MPEVRFTVIIRCAGGTQGLARLLRALDDLDYPAEQFEVLIADSSDRQEPDGAYPQLPQTGYALRYMSLRDASLPEAMNAAVRESQGEFLAFLDEDSIPTPEWLSAYDMAFDSWLAGIVGGSSGPPRDGDVYQKCVGLVHSSLARTLGLVTGQQLVGRYYPRLSNMAARKEAVLLAGGFDEQAVECPEIRMVLRMQHIGYRTFYCPSAAVRHYQEDDLFGFIGTDFRIAMERARYCHQSGVNVLPVGVVALILLMFGLAYDAHTLAVHAVRITVGGYALALALSGLHAAVSVGSLAVAFFLPIFLAMHHAVYLIGLAFGRFTRV